MTHKANSAPKPAIFMHIQKTAGTSIVDIVRGHYGSQNVCSHGDHLQGFNEFPLKDKFFTHKSVLDQLGHLHFISGHFGYDFLKPFIKDRFSFTFLRDPIERILSFYFFCKSRNPEEFSIYRLVQEVSLDEFLERALSAPDVKACIWNTQTWQLASGYGNSQGYTVSCLSAEEMLELALIHLDEFSYVGFSETFEKDRDRILKGLNIPSPAERVVSNSNPNRPVVSDLPSSTITLLHELTHLDRALYEKAWSRKNSLWGKYIRPWVAT